MCDIITIYEPVKQLHHNILYCYVDIFFIFFRPDPPIHYIIVHFGGSIMNCTEFVTFVNGARVYNIRQAVMYFLFFRLRAGEGEGEHNGVDFCLFCSYCIRAI